LGVSSLTGRAGEKPARPFLCQGFILIIPGIAIEISSRSPYLCLLRSKVNDDAWNCCSALVKQNLPLSGERRTIVIGARTQYLVKVSVEDYDFLLPWRWTYAVSHPRHGSLVYARRSISSGGSNVTILMHGVIIAERMGIKRSSEMHSSSMRTATRSITDASMIAACRNCSG
jgi:hypothetical protein